jgi:dipeptidyl aminopeptidase/acylaminoacyl peptidase
MVAFRPSVPVAAKSLPAVFLFLILTTGFLSAAHGEIADAPEQQAGIILDKALVMGPLPVFSNPEIVGDGGGVLPRGKHVAVMEISPGRHLPDAGTRAEQSWQILTSGPDGSLDLHAPGIYWVAARLRSEALADGTLSVPNGRAVFFKGEEVDVLTPEKETGLMEVTLDLDRGWGTVFMRLEIPSGNENGGPTITVAASAEANPVWTLDSGTPLTRFGDSDDLVSIGRLAIADKGRWMMRRINRRHDGMSTTGLFNNKGELVAENPGGSGARPVTFMANGKKLLMKKTGDGGQDLFLHSLPVGSDRTLLQSEPGLGFVKVSADGNQILFLSEKGFEEKSHDAGANRRWDVLRERVSDYSPIPHLHLLDISSGVRRLLSRPVDAVIDDAVFSSDGASIYYARTLPIKEYPWFKSEIRRIELASGSDELMHEFTSGWEVRPQSLVPAPDGKALVFLGPPEEVGAGYPPHNVYNKQVWSLNLESGQLNRVTNDLLYSFSSGGGLPVFDKHGRLLLAANHQGRNLLVRLKPGSDNWSVEELPGKAETNGGVAVSPSGDSVILSASGQATPAAVYYGSTGKKLQLLDEPNTDLNDTWHIAPAEDAAFTTADGIGVDAWFYHPWQMGADGGGSFSAPESGSSPLIVYFYAGSSPTNRNFNTTHQFFAANGYGVLVVNPRGATGYGDEYADHHAGDWGPLAAADIQAATEAILAQYSWLDADGIGIYGGSYGGFMTEYLVTVTDRYAAAVSMYGISDLGTYWGQGAWGWTYGDMALGGRTPWGDKQYFLDHSPLYQADQITTPLLLLHGDEDANVTPGESVQLFTALSVLDRPVEMVTFPGEDHGISGTWENRVAHRTMMLEWFDRYLKAQPEAWSNRWE